MFQNTKQVALLALAFAVAAPGALALGVLPTCTNPQTSCGSGAATNTCCVNSPFGLLMQTQFWDTDPSDGPSNSWTIHGLWPNNCDGTFSENCDSKRAYTNISQILTSFGKTALLSTMNTFWTNDPDDGSNEEFWEHEWATHGTCISTLDTTCYTGYTPTQEVPDFFQTVVNLFETLPTFTWLSAAGITPGTKTYTSAAILAALKAGHGQSVIIQCDGSALNQVYYYFDVKGSVQTGTFIPAAPAGDTSNCPASGVTYKTKTGSPAPTIPVGTGTSTSTTPGTTPTGTGTSLSGSGFFNAIESSGAENGCLISAGTWFTTGTCATYHATASGSGFTLTSSKGNCGISGKEFICGSGVALSTFTAINGFLAFDGSTAFSTTAIPTGQVQATVSTGSGSVDVTFQWESV